MSNQSVIIGGKTIPLVAPKSDLNAASRLPGGKYHVPQAVGGQLNFMATGKQGVMLASANGSSWIEVPMPHNVIYLGVVWAGNKWVAIGPTQWAVSEDGLTWEGGIVAATANFFMLGYCADQDLIVAAGKGSTNTTKIMHSVDGRNWTGISSSVSMTYLSGAGTIEFGGRYGLIPGIATYTQAGLLRADTKALSFTTFNFGATHSAHHCAAYGNGFWIAGGQGGKISSSPADGQGQPGTFTLRTGGGNDNVVARALYDPELGLYLGLGYLAGGAANIWKSSNITAWTSSNVGAQISGLVSAGLVAGDGTRLLGSGNGIYLTEDWATFNQVHSGVDITDMASRI